MKSSDGATTPIWKSIGPAPRHSPPPAGLHTQVCVVGAGITGLSCAYELARQGKQVVVLDEGPVGAGQTERTSAHLASAIDDRFIEVERHHGIDGARAAYEANAAGIDLIERIVKAESIDCDFARLDAYLFPAATDSPDFLDRELQAAHRAGMTGVVKVDNTALAGCSLKGPALCFPAQARFQPLKYLYGLAAAVERLGVKIYTGRRVIGVVGADPKKSTPAQVQFEPDKPGLTADTVIVATNTPAPINDWFGIYTKQASYRTYMVGLRVKREAIADVLYWDNEEPYHYVRLQAEPASTDDVLLVGGEDHKVGQPAEGDPFARLENWARKSFAGAGPVVVKWSGQVQEPADYLPYIGPALTSGQNVYVATGDSGMGLTQGSMAALLLTDLIMGRTNPWAKFFDPGRKTLDRDYVKENANTIAQYADWITGGDVKSADDVPRGEGRVIRQGLSKLAVYRDEKGAVHACSAVCPHLACVVQWNGVEKSWDCPCHGSRFDPTGKVLMGPAVDDLPAAELK